MSVFTRFNHEVEVESFWASGEWTFDEVRNVLARIEVATPEEVRGTLRVQFVEGSYGGRDHLMIVREESTPERGSREAEIAERTVKAKAETAERERLEYERLRQKFEPK